MTHNQAELFYSSHDILGECPVWLPDEERLYWLDIERQHLSRFDPKRGVGELFLLPNQVGCFVPCRNGNFLIAAQTGIEEIRLAENGNIETLETKTHPESAKPENRYNDGKCSPEGRFWFGSLNRQRRTGFASLYVLDGVGCRTMITGATNSNGLGWSPDGKTFYWVDTPTRRVEAFDYDSGAGELSNRRTSIMFPDAGTSEGDAWGRPDGMTVDSDGMIWIAHWLGQRITRWNPKNGSLLETVTVPAKRVTSLTFGGSELKTLFVTAASRQPVSEENNQDAETGNVFFYETKTSGIPVNYYGN
jgi:sugar lactone lactonase YvrE